MSATTTQVTKILKLDPVKNTLLIEKVLMAITTPDGKTTAAILTAEKTLIGSRPGADVVLDDDYVSGRHCEILQAPSGVVIRDLGSTNGTFVDGHRIQETPLSPGAVVTIGKSQLKFTSEPEEEKISPIREDHFCGMVGKTEAMRLLFAKIQKVAPTDSGVLIQGETGSGKELVARALHDLSNRKEKSYVILNCGAISPNLIESELFGHEKGAFTGAYTRRPGAFEEAGGGTLFLDEIGELPLELQPKLLRVLENRTIRRIGSSHEMPVDVRVIAATHRHLPDLVREGKFREDLYFRLYVIPLIVPPLRRRIEDIPLLTEHFLSQASPEKSRRLSGAAYEKLMRYDWPGNIREFKNVILRSLAFCEGETIGPDDIELIDPFAEREVRVNLNQIEKEKIVEALKKTEGNKTKAADLLGIAKSTLFKKLKEYGIE